MKSLSLSASVLLVCSVLLLSCIKDSNQRTFHYVYYVPVYKTMAEVRANIKSNAAMAVERPGKIFTIGRYIFLNETDRGIHVIDNSNPSSPQNVAFIDLPGNMDLAVKGNTLYADMFSDLVAIDISNPRAVVLKKIVEHVFASRIYGGNFTGDSTLVVAYWQKKDTTITAQDNVNQIPQGGGIYMAYAAADKNSFNSASVSPYGAGGSMSRFALLGERLYTVNNSGLNVFSISDGPSFVSNFPISANIETIYPFKDKLFIGSTAGMFIYNTNNPDLPVQEGQFAHVRSCDPVIADGEYAFVTLRSGTACQGFSNELDVVKLNHFTDPALLKAYPMSNPFGLSKDGMLLFICDGKQGLKLYDAADASNLKLIQTIGGLETFDVIAANGKALVVASDGLYQYDYSNPMHLRLLSRMGLTN
ncbi:MAG: LVIVD repeat-containing protein [Flavisolibacter sp.]